MDGRRQVAVGGFESGEPRPHAGSSGREGLHRSLSRHPAARVLGVLVALLLLAAVWASSAFANAPNPTSIKVDGYSVKGTEVEITVSGTWTWNVPNGAQKDCNDSRIGVGYAVSWGDNMTNPLKVQGKNELIYVGTAQDDWVHSVTVGTQTVDGPFKKGPATLEESMLGETPEGMMYMFGKNQGISTGATTAIPTKEDAEHWVSNCGPTKQSKVNGQTIGNSNPGEPEQGFPNGTWGPISHVYKSNGPFKICPVLYDPHGNEVGGNAGNENQIIAGGQHSNNDNSVESNGNTTPCVVELVVPALSTKAEPKEAKSGQAIKDEATISGNKPEGKIFWKLYGPFSSSASINESSCTKEKLAFESTPLTISANGTYPSPTTSLTKPGVYQWTASFESTNTSTNLSVPAVGCGASVEQVTLAENTSFSMVKEQRLSSSAEYTTKELIGEVGQTIEYKITFKNEGNVKETFAQPTDPNCTGMAPASIEVEPGKTGSFTCSHVITEADRAAGKVENVATEKEHKTPPVITKVQSFTIEKAQRLAPATGYVKTQLTGEVGQTVEYQITVKNTGGAPEKFGKVVDAKCSSIAPEEETTLEPGKSETFTCTHLLTEADKTAGKYVNQASITGNGKERKSNEVEVVVVPDKFSMLKEQRLSSAAEYTKAELIGEVGQTVEYKITFKNEGNVKEVFAQPTDANCTGMSPASIEVEPGKEGSFTCSHVITEADRAAGKVENVATEKEHKTPPVITKVQSFTIEKAQRLSAVSEYVKTPLAGEVGQLVEYQITVKNNGAVTEKFGKLVDAKCSGIAPEEETTLEPGKSETFTCTHLLTEADKTAGKYVNQASITGNGKERKSNEVEVTVGPQLFSMFKEQRLSSAAEYTKAELIGEVGQTIEYKITFKNEGNVKEIFTQPSDSNCTGMAPASIEVAQGKEGSFTCSHVITEADRAAGKVENVATEKEHKTPPVITKVQAFTIEKAQRIPPATEYVKSQLTGEVGQTVEYQITVKNTGAVTEKLGKLADPNCFNIIPGTETELEPGKSETFVCTHLLTEADRAAGKYINQASVSGNGKERKSNEVEVLVIAPKFSIRKEQRLSSAAEYTKVELTGEVGQTIEYKITFKNEGNLKQTFGQPTDPNCTGMSPASIEVEPGKEGAFTCSHLITEADREAGKVENVATEKEHKTPPVIVKVQAFTIEKAQRLSPAAEYVKTPLAGEVGETIEYKITVKNTGGVTEKLGALSDAKCTKIEPSTPTELEPGKSETFTCEHKITEADLLAKAPYVNQAAITGNGKERKSNEVEVTVGEGPFSIVKEQRLSSAAEYTKAELTGEVGQTIEYKITFKNEGVVKRTFAQPTDPNCTGMSPASIEVEPGKTGAFTCSHLITEADREAGKVENVATEKEHKTPPVIVKVQSFTIEKKQRLSSANEYVKTPLSGEVGQLVEYQITVKNNGAVTEKFGKLVDAKCSGIAPEEETTLEPGKSETFTCTHLLTEADKTAGKYVNQAAITGNGKERKSNEVEVTVGEGPFSIVKEQRLSSAAEYTKAELTGEVGQTIEYKITFKNEGVVKRTFAQPTDPNCTGMSPASIEVEPGKTGAFTCSHLITEADREAGKVENVATEKEHKTPPVIVKVQSFTIEKKQRLSSANEYVKTPLSGEVGQLVEYQITVKNNGAVTEKFGKLVDAKCSGIAPEEETTLEPGKSETFTCTHLLTEADKTAGKYVNQAAITGNGKERKSNEVEVTVGEGPFSIVKEQRLSSAAEYTKAELTGEVGQTIEYKITFKNEGVVKRTFAQPTDPNCTGMSPASIEVEPGKTGAFTCSHLITEADREAGKVENVATEKEHKTPPVIVKVQSFTIEKKQRLSSANEYVKTPLSGEVGQLVEYQITVKNNGAVTEKFGKLVDAKCSGIAPEEETTLEPGKSETFTCTHLLTEADKTAGKYVNQAAITGNGKERKSNEVEVTVGEGPFSIVKEQRLSSAAEYTKAELTGEVGQTIEYKITFKNEGVVKRTFAQPTDPNCTGMSPASIEVEPGKTGAFTCSHLITEADREAGKVENVATEKEHKTPPVIVKVQSFTIEKKQRLSSANEYVKTPLSGEVGQLVEYQITVKNNGAVTEKFGKLVDAKCSGIAPEEETTLEPGKSETFTCTHLLTEADKTAGKYVNQAAITGNGKERKSNEVEVTVGEGPFSIVKEQRLSSAAEYTKAELTGEVGQTIEYKITFKNEGVVKRTFAQPTDPNCTGMSPASIEVEPGKTGAFTCSHLITEADREAGKVENVATEKEHKTPPVIVKVQSFTIEKKQRLSSANEYVKTPLSGEVGQLVEYQITVKNNGAVTEKFGKLVDAKCSGIAPEEETTLEPGKSETFTCTHLLTSADQKAGVYENTAKIAGNAKEQTSNPVVVKVNEARMEAIAIEKEQRIAGEPVYTKAVLKGRVGQVIEYQIKVTNTGNVKEKLSQLVDPKCSNIEPSTTTELEPEKSELFTCEHKITETDLKAGKYVNTATINGNGAEVGSNPVEVEILPAALLNFKIEKLQEIKGSGKGFTKNSLLISIGQTVDYEIIVTNTGNVKLNLGELKDAKCEGLKGGVASLEPGEVATWECFYVSTIHGDHTNEATLTATDPEGKELTRTSNQVVVFDPSFTVTKLQRIAGTGSEFTTLELNAEVGQTVQYEIVVTDGPLPLSFANFIDANCTNIGGGPGATVLAAGESTTWTCEHKLTTTGLYTNEASVEGNPEAGKKISNKVTVNVAAAHQAVKAACTIAEENINLRGAAGARRGPFKVYISSLGIKEITFYLDGKKFKKLTSSQAKNGQFAITVDPRKLKFGAHKVSIKTAMTDGACATIARSGVFVHPREAKIKPAFTG